jgi:hypothetical protein
MLLNKTPNSSHVWEILPVHINGKTKIGLRKYNLITIFDLKSSNMEANYPNLITICDLRWFSLYYPKLKQQQPKLSNQMTLSASKRKKLAFNLARSYKTKETNGQELN